MQSERHTTARKDTQATRRLVCYTTVFSVVTQRSRTLCDDPKNGCVADYEEMRRVAKDKKFMMTERRLVQLADEIGRNNFYELCE